jgi:hypothetical protein
VSWTCGKELEWSMLLSALPWGEVVDLMHFGGGSANPLVHQALLQIKYLTDVIVSHERQRQQTGHVGASCKGEYATLGMIRWYVHGGGLEGFSDTTQRLSMTWPLEYAQIDGVGRSRYCGGIT